MKDNNVKKIQQEWDEASKRAGVLDQMIIKTNSYFSHSVLMMYKSHILDRIKPSRNDLWLDVCCGTGTNSIVLTHKYDCTIVSFDISIESLRRGIVMKKNLEINKIEFVNADLYNLPFRPDVFDGAIATQSLSYYTFENQKSLLRDLASLIKKNGLFIISDASKGSTSYNLLDSSTYRNLLKEVGFYIIEEKEWGHEFFTFLDRIRLRLLTNIQRRKNMRYLLFKILISYTCLIYKIAIFENYIKNKNGVLFHLVAKK